MSFQPIGSYLPNGPVTLDLGTASAVCENHGPYQSTGMEFTIGRSRGKQRWSGCPECAARVLGEERLAEAERDAAEKAERLRKQLGMTAIPERFIGRTIDSFDPGQPGEKNHEGKLRAKNIASYYAENFAIMKAKGKGLILSGAAGTGKSHLATGILQAILPHHVGVYVTFMGMMHMIRSTYERGAETTERAVIEKLGSVPLLVIDEMGVQRGTEDEHMQLFGIMDSRYAHRLPSILLTNQSSAGLQKFVGDRIFDRLKETTKWVEFAWESHRRVQQ